MGRRRSPCGIGVGRRRFKTRRRREPAFHLHVLRELQGVGRARLFRHFLEPNIVLAEHLDHPRIERGSRLLLHHFHGLIERQRAPVLTVRSERIQAVDRGQNPGANGDLLALNAVRITAAIPFFVMRANDGNHRIGELHTFQNFGADDGMDLHLVELFRSQAAGLGNDVLRHREFADIVQDGSGLQSLFLFARKTEFARDFPRVDLHPRQVIVSGVVLGFDRQGQRFDGAQMQPRHRLGVLPLIIQPADIQAIGAEHQVQHRTGQQHRGPAGEMQQRRLRLAPPRLRPNNTAATRGNTRATP